MCLTNVVLEEALQNEPEDNIQILFTFGSKWIPKEKRTEHFQSEGGKPEEKSNVGWTDTERVWGESGYLFKQIYIWDKIYNSETGMKTYWSRDEISQLVI